MAMGSETGRNGILNFILLENKQKMLNPCQLPCRMHDEPNAIQGQEGQDVADADGQAQEDSVRC